MPHEQFPTSDPIEAVVRGAVRTMLEDLDAALKTAPRSIAMSLVAGEAQDFVLEAVLYEPVAVIVRQRIGDGAIIWPPFVERVEIGPLGGIVEGGKRPFKVTLRIRNPKPPETNGSGLRIVRP